LTNFIHNVVSSTPNLSRNRTHNVLPVEITFDFLHKCLKLKECL
jgi:hypothetical protein